MENKIKLPKAKCLRCGHEWVPRIEKPFHCPNCMSAYWNQIRIEEIKSRS